MANENARNEIRHGLSRRVAGRGFNLGNCRRKPGGWAWDARTLLEGFMGCSRRDSPERRAFTAADVGSDVF
jgi:hypothetical protein